MLRGAQHSATHTTHIPAVAARPLACRADGFMATSFELSVRELLRSRQSENRIANDSARHLWTHSPDGPGTGGQAEHGMNGGFMNDGLPFRGALDVDPSCMGNNRLARLAERNVVVYLGYILTSSVLIMESNCHNTAYFALLFAAQDTHILACIHLPSNVAIRHREPRCISSSPCSLLRRSLQWLSLNRKSSSPNGHRVSKLDNPPL